MKLSLTDLKSLDLDFGFNKIRDIQSVDF